MPIGEGRDMKGQIEKKLWILLLFGLVIRLVGLHAEPPALNSDELIKAYDGACVYLTARDHHGDFLPIFFRQSGEYSPPFYIYLAGLFSAPFGINPYTVRFPSALLGTLTILAAYLFGKACFDKRFALVLAGLVAVSPWNLHYSRIGWEAISLVFIQLCAFTAFYRWLNTRGIAYMIAAAVFFGLTVYTYPTSKLYTPLLLLTLAGIYRKEWKEHASHFATGFGIFLLMMAPYLYILASIQSALEARWQFLSVFQYPNGWAMFFPHYVWHYSPNFLFLQGDANPLHAMPGGICLLVLAPFFLAGLWRILAERKKEHLFLLFWFLTFPIPSAMTYDRFDLYSMPNALRSVAGMPVLAVICALGILYFYQKIPKSQYKNIYKVALITLIAVNLGWVGFLSCRHSLSELETWQYGIPELVVYVEEHKKDYDKVVISHKIGLHPVALASFSGREIKPFTGADFPKYILPFFHYVPIYGDFGHREYLKYKTMAKWYNLAKGNLLLAAKAGVIRAQPIHA
ncbi:phospholipid carrier-dependent glycosyltransferase, partial [bacterium]|nr:phospholipid carrier-dependent glycosyltransferase [bacterium]